MRLSATCADRSFRDPYSTLAPRLFINSRFIVTGVLTRAASVMWTNCFVAATGWLSGPGGEVDEFFYLSNFILHQPVS